MLIKKKALNQDSVKDFWFSYTAGGLEQSTRLLYNSFITKLLSRCFLASHIIQTAFDKYMVALDNLSATKILYIHIYIKSPLKHKSYT